MTKYPSQTRKYDLFAYMKKLFLVISIDKDMASARVTQLHTDNNTEVDNKS